MIVDEKSKQNQCKNEENFYERSTGPTSIDVVQTL